MMKTLLLTSDAVSFEFDQARRVADAVAEAMLGECVCMSWYDQTLDRESPAHVSECHDESCDVPGYVDYARSRGAELIVDVAGGRYVFCYRPLGEFADA
jgi:hypothetical protein